MTSEYKSGPANRRTLEVLILSYNHAAYIRQAVESAFAQEDENTSVFVSIIDDGSSDETPGILDDLERRYEKRIRVVRKSHRGVRAISANLNELIRDAKGDYIAFLASDDHYLPGVLPKCLQRLAEEPQAALLIGQGRNEWPSGSVKAAIDAETTRVLAGEDPVRLESFVTSRIPVIYLQGTVARRSFLQVAPVFDPDLIADDWVFFIEVSRRMKNSKNRFIFYDSAIFTRKFHDKNTSRDNDVHYKRVVEVASKYLAGKNARRVKNIALFKRWRRAFSDDGFWGSLGPLFDYLRVDPLGGRVIVFAAQKTRAQVTRVFGHA